MIVKLDGETGRLAGHYVHAGSLAKFAAVDLEDDGVTEILVGGTNNAYRQACLIVLDPRVVEGHGPATEDYVVANYPPGRQRAYLRIPWTQVARALPYTTGTASVVGLRLATSDSVIVVRVSDGQLMHPPLHVPPRADYFLSFNFQLEPVGYNTATSYDLMARLLVDQGYLDNRPDQAYFEQFMDEILYWDGEEWQEASVMNRQFIDALESQHGQ